MADGATPQLFAPRPSLRVLPDFFGDWVPQEGRVYGIGLASSAVYFATKTETGQAERKYFDAGKGAPHGAMVTYTLPAGVPRETVKLEFLDREGRTLRTYEPKPAGYDKLEEKEKALNPGPWIPVNAGVNRFLWNLRVEGAMRLLGNKTALELNEGPFVPPGRYTVRLAVGETSRSADFEALADPRINLAPEAFAEQYALLLRIRDAVSSAYAKVATLRDVRDQINGWKKRLPEQAALREKADALLAAMAAIEEVIIQPGDQKDTYHLTSRPRLNEAIASLVPVIASADARPTVAAAALVDEYATALDAQGAALDALLATEGVALSRLIAEES
ncbi:MAG: glycosyl hydrolase, partial [Caldilineaceae bacterium]